MVIKKEDYFKRYVGNIDPRRTSSYKKSGLDMKKYSVKPTNYSGLFKIIRKKPYPDTTGYLMNGKVHATKNKLDRRTKSTTQSWEK